MGLAVLPTLLFPGVVLDFVLGVVPGRLPGVRARHGAVRSPSPGPCRCGLRQQAPPYLRSGQPLRRRPWWWSSPHRPQALLASAELSVYLRLL